MRVFLGRVVGRSRHNLGCRWWWWWWLGWLATATLYSLVVVAAMFRWLTGHTAMSPWSYPSHLPALLGCGWCFKVISRSLLAGPHGSCESGTPPTLPQVTRPGNNVFTGNKFTQILQTLYNVTIQNILWKIYPCISFYKKNLYLIIVLLDLNLQFTFYYFQEKSFNN